MCWALYLASDKELPSVPWDEESTSFNTQALSEAEKSVKTQFSFHNIIYLGSHQGCGCGFIAVYEDDPEERVIRQKTVQALSNYLNELLKDGASLEMFLCWEGDEDQPQVGRKTITPADFLASEFPLMAKELASIVA